MTNIFMKQINDAKQFSWKHPISTLKSRYSLKKFINALNNGSPSFGVLWNFADFIRYSEQIYFTKNSINDILYSSYDYKPGENGFKINESNIGITCKLFSDSQKIGIDLEYKNGCKRKTNYTFINEQWSKDPDEYDIILIDRIINIINHQMINLLLDCIKIKFNEEFSYQIPQ